MQVKTHEKQNWWKKVAMNNVKISKKKSAAYTNKKREKYTQHFWKDEW